MTAAHDKDELAAKLQALEGRSLGEPREGRDPVNQPMIRHWCDAMEDSNPNYTDPEFAASSPHGGIVAPPTMLQAWAMRGLEPTTEPATGSAHHELFALLDAAGFTSIVATNCEQEYVRYLHPGDVISCGVRIDTISEEKHTALGDGHFIDQVYTFRDGSGEIVGTMRFRIFKFSPSETAQAALSVPDPVRPRPKPAETADNAFFWEGIRAGKLLIQRCRDCRELRHPPTPMCPSCHSFEWETLEASGRGYVYSFVVAHHPPVPPFEYPHIIALIELEEGTRLVANLQGIESGNVEIGLPVEVGFVEVEPGLRLPQFRPARA